jgi:hypothetical protein
VKLAVIRQSARLFFAAKQIATAGACCDSHDSYQVKQPVIHFVYFVGNGQM